MGRWGDSGRGLEAGLENREEVWVRVRLGLSLRNHGEEDTSETSDQGHQSGTTVPATRQEVGKAESEGGDTDWLGHFCPQGSAFLRG